MIYTGAVYGAFKKDRGADIKTSLFMDNGNTRAVVRTCTIECVFLCQRGLLKGVCMGACLQVLNSNSKESTMRRTHE